MRHDHPTLKSLSNTVGGDESEVADLTCTDKFGGAVPPLHYVVGSFGNVAIDRPKRFRVAIAQLAPHSPVAEKGRVSHDEIGRGPFSPAGSYVSKKRLPRRIIRDWLPGHRMGPC